MKLIRELAIDACKKANINLNNLETLTAQESIISTPSHFEVDFLSECNLRCIMCHQAKYNMPHNKLSKKSIDAIINQLPFVETVMIAGLGEPLLYKNISYFLSYLSRYRCYSHMFTNGMLIDKRIDDLKKLNKLSISFDGDNQSTFEYLRNRSEFSKIISNIKQLHHHAPELLLATSTVISNRNVNQIKGIVNLAQECGIKEVHLSPVDHTPELALTPKDLETFKNQIASIPNSGIKVFNNINDSHFNRKNSKVTKADTQLEKLLSKAPQKATKPEKSNPTIKRYIQQLSPIGEIRELWRRAKKLKERAKQIQESIRIGTLTPKIPSCTAVWKYGFFRSSNQIRLCPYAAINTGDVESVINNNFNSKMLHLARKQFDDGQQTLSVCTNCNDDHRKFKFEELHKLKEDIT